MVTFGPLECQGKRFEPRSAQKYVSIVFCSMRTLAPPLEPPHRVPEPVQNLETHLKSEDPGIETRRQNKLNNSNRCCHSLQDYNAKVC